MHIEEVKVFNDFYFCFVHFLSHGLFVGSSLYFYVICWAAKELHFVEVVKVWNQCRRIFWGHSQRPLTRWLDEFLKNRSRTTSRRVHFFITFSINKECQLMLRHLKHPRACLHKQMDRNETKMTTKKTAETNELREKILMSKGGCCIINLFWVAHEGIAVSPLNYSLRTKKVRIT